jgi:hypothetical protein
LAGIFNGSTASLFVDGGLVDSRSALGGLQSSNVALTLGSFSDGVNSFNGSVDEVVVYNRVLSDSEIKAIYDCGLP